MVVLSYDRKRGLIYNNFLIKINKMLSLFNFYIEVSAQNDTFKLILMLLSKADILQVSKKALKHLRCLMSSNISNTEHADCNLQCSNTLTTISYLSVHYTRHAIHTQTLTLPILGSPRAILKSGSTWACSIRCAYTCSSCSLQLPLPGEQAFGSGNLGGIYSTAGGAAGLGDCNSFTASLTSAIVICLCVSSCCNKYFFMNYLGKAAVETSKTLRTPSGGTHTASGGTHITYCFNVQS